MAQLAIFIGLWSLLLLIVSMSSLIIFGQNQDVQVVLDNIESSGISSIIWVNLLMQVLGFMLPVLLFGYFSDPRPFNYLELKPINTKQLPIIILIGASMPFLFPVMSSIIHEIDFGAWANDIQDQRNQMEELYLKDKDVLSIARNLFLLALIPAVSEELFFRGILQRFINTWVKKPAIAIVITSIIFAMLHYSVYNLIPIFLASMLLGWIFHVSGNLWMSIIVHFIYNGFQVIQVAFLDTSDTAVLDNSLILMFTIYTISTGVVILLMHLLKKKATPLADDWSVVAIKSEL